MSEVFRRSGPERLVSGGVWFLTLMVLSGFFWMAWSVVVSRVYGPFGYGVFNTSYSLYSFAWAFIFGGLFEGLIKYGSEYLVSDRWSLSSLFSTSLRYLTGIGIVIFLLLFALSFNISNPSWRVTVLSIAFSFLFSGTKDALSSIIGALHQNDQLSIINASRSVVVLLSGGVFVALSFPPVLLPALLVIATVWQLMLSVYFLRSRLNKILSFDLKSLIFGNRGFGMEGEFMEFTHVFVFGFFVSLGITAFNIMKSLDIVVVKFFFDYTKVGVYSVADTVSSILFYMTSFSLPVISSISDAYAKRDEKLMGENVGIAVKYPLLIGVPLTLIILFMARPIVLGVYGSAFEGAVEPLQILIVGTFMLMLGYTLSSILIGIGRSKLSGVLMAAAAVQYVVSVFVLTPLYGLTGAALSLTLTGFTSLLLVPYFIWRNLKVSVFSGVPKVLLSASVMAIVLYITPHSNPLIISLGMVAGVAVFVLILYLLGYLTKEDLQMIRIAGESFRRKGS